MKTKVTLYTDGACTQMAGGGPGGWAAILVAENEERLIKKVHYVGFETHTTNNAMELMAVYEGLKQINRPDVCITIVTDSKYVIGQLSENWKRNANVELLENIEALIAEKKLTITWEHTRGHQNHLMNNECDRLAVEQKQRAKLERA